MLAHPRERESQFHEFDDRDPVVRMTQALEESAIERLADDQRPLPSGPKDRTRAEIERRQLSESDRTRIALLDQQRLATLFTGAALTCVLVRSRDFHAAEPERPAEEAAFALAA